MSIIPSDTLGQRTKPKSPVMVDEGYVIWMPHSFDFALYGVYDVITTVPKFIWGQPNLKNFLLVFSDEEVNNIVKGLGDDGCILGTSSTQYSTAVRAMIVLLTVTKPYQIKDVWHHPVPWSIPISNGDHDFTKAERLL